MRCGRNNSLTDACWHLHYVNCCSTLPRLLRVPPKLNHISPAIHMELRKHNAHRTSESHDMLLYLAGVNEHGALRIV
jgi:hypothetical protein